MLPLSSQRIIPFREFEEMNPYASLQQNRVKLCKEEYPMMSDIMKNSKPNVDRTLLGGLLPIKSISFKEAKLTFPIVNLSTDKPSSFLSYLEVTIDETEDLDSRRSKLMSPVDLHKCYYGNADVAKFATIIALIPVWSNESDVIDKMSTDYDLMGISRTLSERKRKQIKIGRNINLHGASILGSKRGNQHLLDMLDVVNLNFNDDINRKKSEESRKKPKVLPSFTSFCENESGMKHKAEKGEQSTIPITNDKGMTKLFIPDLLVLIDESNYKSLADKSLMNNFLRNDPYRKKNFIGTSAPFGKCLSSNAVVNSNQIMTQLHMKIHKDEYENISFMGVVGKELDDLIEMKMVEIKEKHEIAANSWQIDLNTNSLLWDYTAPNLKPMETNRSYIDLNIDDMSVRNGLKKEMDVQIINDPWLKAIQPDANKKKEKNRFQVLDLLLTELFLDGKSRNKSEINNFDYSTQQFSSSLFCSSFFQSDKSFNSKQKHYFKKISPEKSGDYNEKTATATLSSTSTSTSSSQPFSWISYFKPKPLSLKTQCPNLISNLPSNQNNSDLENNQHQNFTNRKCSFHRNNDNKNRNDSSRLSVIDRMLSNTHALRCIPITPSRSTQKYCQSFSKPTQEHNILRHIERKYGKHVQFAPYINGLWVRDIGFYIIDVIKPKLKYSSRTMRTIENKQRANQEMKGKSNPKRFLRFEICEFDKKYQLKSDDVILLK